jgi:probable rRNA maturation factor
MGPSDPLITFRRVPERAGFQREDLEAFAQLLKARVARGREFHCRITGDAELQRLNREYLGKDYPTDVLSFPADGEFLGDLAISRHRAAAQARKFRHSITQELQLLMLHGVLHLMGFDHERDGGQMARVERSWQTKLRLPTSLIERTHAPGIHAAAAERTAV